MNRWVFLWYSLFFVAGGSAATEKASPLPGNSPQPLDNLRFDVIDARGFLNYNAIMGNFGWNWSKY